MHRRCWKFPNRNVQTCGFVCHFTNGQNHGPVWKTKSFFLNEICTVILWQDYYGKDNSRKFFWKADRRAFQSGTVYSLTEKKDYLCLCTGRFQNGRKETKSGSIVENTHERRWCGRAVTMFIRVALKGNVRSARLWWTWQKYVRIQDFCLDYGMATCF